jgi:hypothetical protein
MVLIVNVPQHRASCGKKGYDKIKRIPAHKQFLTLTSRAVSRPLPKTDKKRSAH